MSGAPPRGPGPAPVPLQACLPVPCGVGANGHDKTSEIIEKSFFGPQRQYVRWDTGLHELFEAAVNALGGAHAAKPANIRDRMGIPLLTTAQVKSHLQKHRIRVVAENGTKDATEAQARAAAKLLERQKRQAGSGAAPPRPRVLVPIRGSRQMSGGLALASLAAGLGGADASHRPKRRTRKRRLYSDSFSSSGDEGDAAGQWDAEEEEADEDEEDGARLARRSRRAPYHNFGAEPPSVSAAAPRSDGRSAGQAAELPLAELSRLLGAEGLDAATLAGLAQHGFMAQPQQQPQPHQQQRAAYESSGEPAVTSLLPFFGGPPAAAGAQPAAPPPVPMSVDGAVATLNRQVQLEHALLEQSMWVQKLAAEVQELRARQRMGLPPPPPDAMALASPFALMAQAAFPAGAEPSPGKGGPGMPPPPPPAAAAVAALAAAPPVPAPKSPSGPPTCDSTLLRLLSSTLGGQLSKQEASDAALALLQGIEGLAADRAASQQSNGGMMSMDSGLLRMLSQSLRDPTWQQPSGDTAGDPATQAPAAAAPATTKLAAEGGGPPALAAAAAAAASAASPFAAAGAQLAPPPTLPPLAPGPRLPALSLPPPGPNGNRQTSLEIFNNGLLALGLAGAASVAASQPRALSAEFLRLCSLPGVADLLPPSDT